MDIQDVNIESIAGNSNLSEWASEKTQSLMLKTLDNLHRTITNDNKKLISALIKSNSKKSGKSGKSDESKASEDLVEQKIKEKNETTKSTDALKKKTKSVAIAASALSGLANVAGRYIGMFAKTYQEYDSIVKSGALDSINNNISLGQGIGNLMRDSNANLSALSEAFIENSRAIKIYGARPFVQTANIMRDSMYGFGMTSNDTIKFIGKNLEQQRKLGFVNRLTQNQQIVYLKNSTSALFKFSKALGISYEELLKEAEEATAGSDFAMFLRTLGNGAEKVKHSADIVSYSIGGSLGSVIAEFSTLREGTAGMSESFVKMQERGLGPLANEMWSLSRQVRAGTITEANAQESLNNIFKTAKNYNTDELYTMLRSVSSVLGISADEMFKDLSTLAQRNDALEGINFKELKAQNDQVAQMKKLQDRWNNMFVQLQASVINSFDNLFDSEKSQLGKNVTDLFDKVAKFFASPDFIKTIDSTISSIMAVINMAIDNFPMLVNKISSLIDKADQFIDKLNELTNGNGIAAFVGAIIGGTILLKAAIGKLISVLSGAAFGKSLPSNTSTTGTSRRNKSNKNKSRTPRMSLRGAGNVASKAALPAMAALGAYQLFEFGKAAVQLEKTNASLIESKEGAARTSVKATSMVKQMNQQLGTNFKTLDQFVAAQEAGQLNFEADSSGNFRRIPIDPNARSNSSFDQDNKQDSTKDAIKQETESLLKPLSKSDINKDNNTVSKLQELIDIQTNLLAMQERQLRILSSGLSNDSKYNYS